MRPDARLWLMPDFWKRCWLGLLTAFLLNLPFPIAGPVPAWRTAFAFLGAVPLLYALLRRDSLDSRRYLLKSFLVSWITGIAWYGINCYWIFQTMYLYGGLPAAVSAGILILFSLILGLYFGMFGWMVALLRLTLGSRAALVAVPFLWVTTDLLASLVTKVPWDQLGYAEVGNFLLTRLAPYTGVYGVTFLLQCINVLLVTAFLSIRVRWRAGLACAWVAVVALLLLSQTAPPPASPTQATATLLQENLSVTQSNQWIGAEWEQNVSLYIDASQRSCTDYFAGLPETKAPWVQPACPARTVLPDLVAWPEAPSPFRQHDLRFQQVVKSLADVTHAPAIVGNLAIDVDPYKPISRESVSVYNAAAFVSSDGRFVGRYNKIHLVPWGEYVPFQKFFAFAGHLTHQVGDMTHGWRRDLFATGGHKVGVFICYESIFADEIRIFAKEGADVFVNISDDGWYGDTSAPWQHLNMARMRAIENRRWLLRSTNTGVTCVIDPYGRVTASVPRHIFTSLAARYGYRNDRTFYTLYGNVFAYLCGIMTLAAVTFAGACSGRSRAA